MNRREKADRRKRQALERARTARVAIGGAARGPFRASSPGVETEQHTAIVVSVRPSDGSHRIASMHLGLIKGARWLATHAEPDSAGTRGFLAKVRTSYESAHPGQQVTALFLLEGRQELGEIRGLDHMFELLGQHDVWLRWGGETPGRAAVVEPRPPDDADVVILAGRPPAIDIEGLRPTLTELADFIATVVDRVTTDAPHEGLCVRRAVLAWLGAVAVMGGRAWHFRGGSLLVATGDGECLTGWDVDLARVDRPGTKNEFHAWLAIESGDDVIIYDPSTRYLPGVAGYAQMRWLREVRPMAFDTVERLWNDRYMYRPDEEVTERLVREMVPLEMERCCEKPNEFGRVLAEWAKARRAGIPFSFDLRGP